MAKQYKIKRYNGLYRSRRSPLMKLLTVLLWILVVAVLVGLGFYGYQLVMDYIENGGASQSSESSLPSSSSQAVSSSTSSRPVRQEPVYSGVTKAVLLPQDISASALESFLENAKEHGANTVVVTYKDDEGIVYHDTAVSMAHEGYAVAENPDDLSEIAKAIKDAGLFPAALIYGFEDHTVSYQLRDVAGHYKDEEYLWYDESPDKGGKAWLNPYNEDAQNYLIDLAAEAAELGFEEIIMDGVHFPKGYQLEAINFGETNGVTKSEVLRSFTDSLREILEGKGARLSMVVLASDITSPNGFTYGESSAVEIFDCKLYLDLTETDSAQMQEVTEEILSGKTGDFGVFLTDQDAAEEQLDALKKLGAKNWFLRSWAEDYPLI